MTYCECGDFHCECGYVTGTACAWHGPIGETVIVEYTPESIRASAIAARNGGIYPHNGSVRVRCERSCADRLVADEPEWAEIIAE